MRELIEEVQCDSNGRIRFKLKGELVRCGECKHWEEESTFCLNKDGCYGSETKADWFCADGKRKDGKENGN